MVHGWWLIQSVSFMTLLSVWDYGITGTLLITGILATLSVASL
jgi:hypothetical protein